MPLPHPTQSTPPFEIVSRDDLSIQFEKIRAFNAISLPENYPVAKYIYKIKLNEFTSADFDLLAGEIDGAKTKYDRSGSLTPLLQLKALHYAALSGKTNALTNCALLFQINIDKISLIDLFTILHSAALGGNIQVVEQAIEWIHAHHRDRSKFKSIASLLPSRLILTTLAWVLVVGMAFTAVNAISTNDMFQIILMNVLLAILLAAAIAVTHVMWNSPIDLLRRFPGFDAKSRQTLDASAGIALIAAILSDNPQVIEAISSKMLRYSSISYPIPAVRVITYTPYGSKTTERTTDNFLPNYIDFATGKTAATQSYTLALTKYYSTCCYRRHPEAPGTTTQSTNEFRMFTTPQPVRPTTLRGTSPQGEAHIAPITIEFGT